MRVALWKARPRTGGVDAVLTDGRLLSCASTDESIASAWNLRPRRVRGKRARAVYWGVQWGKPYGRPYVCRPRSGGS